DGVPFAVPGQRGLVTDPWWRSENPTEVPDFIQALENQDLREPGTVAQLTLRLPRFLPVNEPEPEPVERVVITERGRLGGEWDIEPTGKKMPANWNSCIVLYWPEREMKPGEDRTFVFAYGLGKLTHEYGSPDPHLALTYGPRPVPGGEFTIMA